MEKFGLSTLASQVLLFLLLMAAAVGALIAGVLSHAIGRRQINWLSVLGPLPLNLIMANAFAPILNYAMDLLPNRIGLIVGIFYGLNFDLGGIAVALLGILADSYRLRRSIGLVPSCRWRDYPFGSCRRLRKDELRRIERMAASGQARL